MLYIGRRRWKNHVFLVCIIVVICLLMWMKDFISYDVGSAQTKADVNSAQTRERRNEAKRRVMERRRRLEAVCNSTWPHPHQANYLHSNQVLVSWNTAFLHCPVAKAASTFWYRFLHILNQPGPLKSPFKAPIMGVTDTVTSSLNSLRHIDDRADFVNSAFRTIFVRNPYSRMLSAYVDKVFAPNPTFWKFWGQKAIQNYRTDANPKSLRCGHDVTFAEVLAYARKRLYKSDVHFKPIVQLCKPCGFRFPFVGKMETFTQDIRLLAQTLNLSTLPYFESQQFTEDYVRDAIEDSINSPFSWMSDILPCMSKYEAGRRIWRKLQIRGLVSRRIRFPFTETAFEDVTAEEMVKTAVEAHRNSGGREELKQQKREAFREAYRSVSGRLLQQWADILREDFAIFGYQARPPDIFAERHTVPGGIFDWEKDW